MVDHAPTRAVLDHGPDIHYRRSTELIDPAAMEMQGIAAFHVRPRPHGLGPGYNNVGIFDSDVVDPNGLVCTTEILKPRPGNIDRADMHEHHMAMPMHGRVRGVVGIFRVINDISRHIAHVDLKRRTRCSMLVDQRLSERDDSSVDRGDRTYLILMIRGRETLAARIRIHPRPLA